MNQKEIYLSGISENKNPMIKLTKVDGKFLRIKSIK